MKSSAIASIDLILSVSERKNRNPFAKSPDVSLKKNTKPRIANTPPVDFKILDLPIFFASDSCMVSGNFR